MFKIQTLNTIAPQGLAQFPPELYEVSKEIQQPDAILVRSADMHGMKLPSSVKVVGRAGAGVNNIPITELTQLGIPVLNTPGANANAVRELVVAGMLMASRNLCQAWHYVRELETADAELNKQIELDKKQFVGFELLGKTLGIIGLGSVGVKVANAALGLGMHVIGYDPTITVSRAWELSSKVQQANSIDEVLMASDFLTVHVPLLEDTKHMIDAQRLHLLKPEAVILNFARAEIVDQKALLTALRDKKIRAYVTDFPSHELKQLPQVICLPHLGASTHEAEENCAVMIVKEIKDFLEKGSILHSVNFPTIEMPLSRAGIRLGIVNLNIPNMVAQISTQLGQAGLNIISLLNKSRNDIAYTLIDVDKVVSPGLLKALVAIQGVIQVRKIG